MVARTETIPHAIEPGTLRYQKPQKYAVLEISTHTIERSSNSGTLFKRSPRGPWIARWVESPTSRPERSTKTTDRALATRILAQWVEEAMLRRSGLVDARAESLRRHESAPIREHLAAFLAYLNTKGTAPDTIDAHERNILRLIDWANIDSIGDLSPAVVLAAANTLRTPSPTRPTGLSLKTINHSIGSIPGFSRWLASERRARVDELAGLRGFNAHTDRRRIRRDLSADELSRLIAAAARLPVAIVPWPERGGDGVRRIVRRRVRLPDRAWAYRIAGGPASAPVRLPASRPRVSTLMRIPRPLRSKRHTASTGGATCSRSAAIWPSCSRRGWRARRRGFPSARCPMARRRRSCVPTSAPHGQRGYARGQHRSSGGHAGMTRHSFARSMLPGEWRTPTVCGRRISRAWWIPAPRARLRWN